MNSIAETISKAIKEGKWLDITYQNLENSETHFWIAIEDIDAKTKTFSCKIFNHNKSFNSLNAHIKFDQIKSATILFLHLLKLLLIFLKNYLNSILMIYHG